MPPTILQLWSHHVSSCGLPVYGATAKQTGPDGRGVVGCTVGWVTTGGWVTAGASVLELGLGVAWPGGGAWPCLHSHTVGGHVPPGMEHMVLHHVSRFELLRGGLE